MDHTGEFPQPQLKAQLIPSQLNFSVTCRPSARSSQRNRSQINLPEAQF